MAENRKRKQILKKIYSRQFLFKNRNQRQAIFTTMEVNYN